MFAPAVSLAAGSVNDGCAVDQLMLSNLKASNQRSKAAIESTHKQADLEREACLPVLNQINTSISASIPTFDGIAKNLGSKARDLACNALDGAIESYAGQLNAGWEAPYGLASVGGGLNTKGAQENKFDLENKALIKTLDEEALRGTSDLLNKGVNATDTGFDSATSDVTGINRDAANEYESRFEESRRELLDAF